MIFFVIILIMAVLAACSGSESSPTPVPTPLPSATPSQAPTFSPVPATSVIEQAVLGEKPTLSTKAGICSGAENIVLSNGHILTMDDNDSIASSVRIENDRFVAVGEFATGDVEVIAGDCVIDLGGRTVTPGLIDSHIHLEQPSQAPGHFLSGIETASSIPEPLTKLADLAATLPSGEFITAVGGLGPPQFTEGRFPTLGELDTVSPNHPVYLQAGFRDPSVTNTLGKEHFDAAGVSVSESGAIGQAGPALTALIQNQTDAEARTAALEYMEYASSVGLTTAVDQGCCFWFGVNLPADQVHGYQTYYDLWEQGKLSLRLRFGGGGTPGPNGLPKAVAIRDAAMDSIGEEDDMLRIVGVGEFTVGGFGQTSGVSFVEAFGQIAERGLTLSQHSISAEEHQAHIPAFEAVNANIPIADLRWSSDRGFRLTREHLSRLKDIGSGIIVSNTAYLPITPFSGAAPYRDILDIGVRAGASLDSSNISTLNPWLNIYFMVAGKYVTGEMVNDGQQIDRLEALRLYTMGSAWFSSEEDELGFIEVGKLADLVVLNNDYLSVSEEEIKGISSVLTIIGGNVVYADEEFLP
ncbi:MAG TPA: hypothetical protein EYM38_08195 [Dehalococcoidia bacterium]|nr:hypothetical protein [Dehalococcoidia bacterium]